MCPSGYSQDATRPVQMEPAIREQGDRHAKAFAGRHRGCGGDGRGVGRGGRLEPSGLQGAAADSGVQLDRLVRRRACRWRLGDEGVVRSDRYRFDGFTTFTLSRHDHQQLRRQRIPGRCADRLQLPERTVGVGRRSAGELGRHSRQPTACPFFIGKTPPARPMSTRSAASPCGSAAPSTAPCCT